MISPEELGFTNIVSGRYGAWLEDNIDQVTSYGYWSSVYQKKIFIGKDENGYFSRSTYGVRPVINVRPSVAFSD